MKRRIILRGLVFTSALVLTLATLTHCDEDDPEQVCGNGRVETGEQCDDGSANSNTAPDACRNNCLNAWCGDGVRDSGEECDDGNLTSGDGCTDLCVDEDPSGPVTVTYGFTASGDATTCVGAGVHYVDIELLSASDMSVVESVENLPCDTMNHWIGQDVPLGVYDVRVTAMATADATVLGIGTTEDFSHNSMTGSSVDVTVPLN